MSLLENVENNDRLTMYLLWPIKQHKCCPKKPTAVVMLVYLLYLFGTTIHACQYVFAEKFYINIHTCFLIKD